MTSAAPHLGYFAEHHLNPPAPFNPDADPLAKRRYAQVTASMISDGFYKSHTREECKAEWGARYGALQAAPSLDPLERSLEIIRSYEPDSEEPAAMKI